MWSAWPWVRKTASTVSGSGQARQSSGTTEWPQSISRVKPSRSSSEAEFGCSGSNASPTPSGVMRMLRQSPPSAAASGKNMSSSFVGVVLMEPTLAMNCAVAITFAGRSVKA